jgi:archaeal flagellar protein FlaI
MLDLLVNALRMRPDRILVGEIRRKAEAEVLLEAMHTGHSVYATIHANNAEEVVTRLTNPPIDIPKAMISSLSLVIVQNRNRRNGKRRTFQVAEITPLGDPRVLMRYNPQNDTVERINESEYLFERISLYTGMSKQDIEFDLQQKARILQWLVQKKVENVDDIGLKLAKYYLGNLQLD